jgi:hypothetical protein
MGNLILQGDDTEYLGFSLLGETTLIITMDETGASPLAFNRLDFLVLNGTTSVTIASTGAINGGTNELGQLAVKNNVLTTVTINGAEEFRMGSFLTGHANSGDAVVTDIGATAASPTTIHSSLTLINASSMPAGGVEILAGATNTSGAGNFANGASLNANVTITYTGLTIKGAGNDSIENDAKNGIVIDGNGSDSAVLGGAGAKATLGIGADRVFVGVSNLGTNETAGSALGDKVTFGSAATAKLDDRFHESCQLS